MISKFAPARLAKRMAIGVTVGALALTGATGGAGATTAAGSIDTWTTWDGSHTLGFFGHPETPTYGQTLTIPAGQRHFKWVRWYQRAWNTGDLVFRAELYTWDGSKAGKPVAESKAKTLGLDGEDPAYHGVKFRFRKAKVRPGRQYVVFATVSKDYEETTPNLWSIWPVHNPSGLDGGNTVWLNDAGDESLWTTQVWGQFAGQDMAFQAMIE